MRKRIEYLIRLIIGVIIMLIVAFFKNDEATASSILLGIGLGMALSVTVDSTVIAIMKIAATLKEFKQWLNEIHNDN
jgi:uncharacterized protein YabE (DUF348 family)